MDLRLVCEIGVEHYGPDELRQNAVLHRMEQKHLQVRSAFGSRSGSWPAMGIRNNLIEGVSGTGKTSVCKELQRRGHRKMSGAENKPNGNSFCDCIKRRRDSEERHRHRRHRTARARR